MKGDGVISVFLDVVLFFLQGYHKSEAGPCSRGLSISAFDQPSVALKVQCVFGEK